MCQAFCPHISDASPCWQLPAYLDTPFYAPHFDCAPVWQGVTVDFEEGPAAIADDTLREKLRETISNTRLSERFLALARDLDVMEPRAPDDVRVMLSVLGSANAVLCCAALCCPVAMQEQHDT